MRRRTLIVTILIAIALIVWLVVYLWPSSDNSRLTIVSTGPLDIRLWGIHPDEGDFIYDPNGNVIQETLGIALSDPPYWGEEFQCFDFIFVLPDDESMRFVNLPEIEVGGEGRHLGGSASQVFFDYQGRRLLWLRATMPRTFRRSVLRGLWELDTAFDAVDITVRHYHDAVESPHDTTFRNVNLNVAGRKRRSYPAYLDEMAERLGLSLTGKELAEYDLESEAQVLEVIDIVRGNVLVRAKNTLHRLCRGGRLAPNALTDEQARRLRHTLGRWLTAIDPLIRAFAVEIGLLCRWTEFVEPALQLLERPVRRGYESTRGAQYMAARALQGRAGELSDEQIRRIEDLLLDESRKDIHSSLRRVLKSQAAETRD